MITGNSFWKGTKKKRDFHNSPGFVIWWKQCCWNKECVKNDYARSDEEIFLNPLPGKLWAIFSCHVYHFCLFLFGRHMHRPNLSVRNETGEEEISKTANFCVLYELLVSYNENNFPFPFGLITLKVTVIGKHISSIRLDNCIELVGLF